MNLETQNTDVVEILDLEYDVAAVGAAESSHSEENQAAWYLFSFRLPEKTA